MGITFVRNIIIIIIIIDRSAIDAFVPLIQSPPPHNIARHHTMFQQNDQTPPQPAHTASASAAIDFLTLTRNLKTTKRTGWIHRGVHHPESIADHMYRMSLMAMISSFSTSLNTDRCIKLALVHDLAEAKVGDITPHCGVSEKDKYELELDTMEYISNMLGPLMGGDEILELWKEYEDGTTEEARLLKDLDKIEMILQAQEYEAEGSHDKTLDQFFTSTEGKWKTEIGKAWAAEIVRRRKKISHPESINGKKDDEDS
jgi:putative hydrolase of HD superfamily